MDKFQKNFAIGWLCLLAVVFFVSEFTTHLFFQQPVDSLISQNRVAITKIYAGQRPEPTLHNPYIELALPSGMELFAMHNNNFKLRYQRFYFEMHTFTSEIDSLEYSKAKFPVERLYNLADFNEQPVFFYVKEFGTGVSQLALYTNSLEITTKVPTAALETALLKSVELMRNTNPLKNEQSSVVIDGEGSNLSTPRGVDLDRENETEKETNAEMPLVRT